MAGGLPPQFLHFRDVAPVSGVTLVAGARVGLMSNVMAIVAYEGFWAVLVDLACKRASLDIFQQGLALESDKDVRPARFDDIVVQNIVGSTSQACLEKVVPLAWVELEAG